MKITLVIKKINHHQDYIIKHLKKFLLHINSWINFDLKIDDENENY